MWAEELQATAQISGLVIPRLARGRKVSRLRNGGCVSHQIPWEVPVLEGIYVCIWHEWKGLFFIIINLFFYNFFF